MNDEVAKVEVVEDKPKTIAEEIQAAIDADAQEEQTQETQATEETTTEATTVEETTAAEDTTQETTEETTVEETTEVVEFKPPEHFSDPDKKIFEGLPQEQQEWMLGRYKDMEADHTKKTQDIAEFKRTYEPVHQLIEPIRQNLILNGVTPGQYIERLMTADSYLTKQPKEAIRWLMQSYGVSLDALESDAEDTSDPEIQGLRNELTDLRSSIDKRHEADQTALYTSAANQITEFKEAKDKAGKPLHPLLDDVMEDVTRLAHADRSIGKTPDLADLYDRAVWANPTTRAKALETQNKSQAEAGKREAAKKAAKAKEASASVEGGPGGTEETPLADLPLRQQLEKQILQ